MAGHNDFNKIRRSSPEQVAEHRRWARFVVDGATLAELRGLKGKTQAEVGAALGVTQVQAGRIEKGGEEMQVSSLRRYLDALGLELEGIQVRDREHDERVILVRLPPGVGESPAGPAKRQPGAARVTDRLRRRRQS
jgi:transcriptional regulator with XRE-family HTH domain